MESQPWVLSSVWLWGSLAIMPINVAPSLLLMLWGILTHIGRTPTDRVTLFSGILVALILALIPTHPDWPQSLAGSCNLWPFVLIMLACRDPLSQVQLRQKLIQVLLLGGILISLLGLGQALLGWHYHLGWDPLLITLDPLSMTGGRPTSIFASPNTLAVYLVMLQALALGSLRSQVFPRWLTGLSLGSSLPLLILTASRNGWGIAWVGLVIWLVWGHRWRWLAGILGLTALPVGAALNWLGLRQVMPMALWGRLADTLDPQATHFSSTANRVDGWQFALHMIQQRPWTGWGWQQFPVAYNARIPTPPEHLTHPHNLLLYLGAEGGIPITLGLLGLWAWLLWRGWRQAGRDPLALGVGLALTCYFVSGGLDVVLFDARIHLLVWVLLAWCAGKGIPDRMAVLD